MLSLRCRAADVMIVAATLIASPLVAQPCADLPPLEPPKLETCKGGFKEKLQAMAGAGCLGRNEARQMAFDRMSRGFATGLTYDSEGLLFGALAREPRQVTVDSLRGCRGENVNLELFPGNVTYFEYELVAPSGVILSRQSYSTWSGDKILGENVTLSESGYYVLKTRTTAPSRVRSYKRKDGSTEYQTDYPRRFRVAFRSDATVAALGAGDRVDATVNAKQPFIRRVSVKGGTKVRFRFASQGTGDFLVKVMRETGEELYRNGAPTGFYETRAITPKTDETFRVEVRPWLETQSVGVQFSVVDDKATGEPVTATSRVASSFKLPAHFDGTQSPSVSTSETARLLFQATAPVRLAMTLRPSQLAGLKMRVRVFNEDTEELAIKPVTVSETTTLALSLVSAGQWVIELQPMAAPELEENGEAKYTVEFAPAAAPAAPRAGARASRAPR